MSMMHKVAGSLLGAGVLWLAGAGVASAHVTVAAPGVTAGSSDAQIVFRVPDESASASTIGLKVQLPIDHPIAGVLVEPVAGWTPKVTTTKLATPITTDDGTIAEVVSEIDWTAAADGGIRPGFFGAFTIIAGQLPGGVNSLTFKAIQTYSDHSVVSWIEVPAPGSTDEPDHPAPVLQFRSAAGLDSPTASESATADVPAASSPSSTATSVSGLSAAATPVVATSDAASKVSVTWALVVGIVGVVVGAAGVGLAVTGRRRPVR